MVKHFKIRVTGRVQGVWYRGSMQKKARELGLTGWVKNEPDGSVQAEAEGTGHQLLELVAWCKKGPELAVVESVEVLEGEVVGYGSFDVLR